MLNTNFDAQADNLTNEKAGFDYKKLDTYCGYFYEDDLLLKSASGGAAAAISEAIIKMGGCVFGATYSKDFYRAEYMCAETFEDLNKLKGSKYCETSKEIVSDGTARNVFEVLAEKLDQNIYVLFTGLGCDVAAAKSYCAAKHINTDKLYTVEILCHGPTTAEVHKQYIKNLEKEYNSKIIDFTVRYKKKGWTPSYIRAVFKNGDVYEIPFYESDYGFAFDRLIRQPCFHCNFRGDNHKGDITVGDFWGLTDSMKNWNKNGVSIIFVQTEKGKKLIDLIDKAKFHISPADTEFALRYNTNYFTCRSMPADYELFAKNLKEYGLHYAVQHAPIGLKARIKKILKAILPLWAINALKNILEGKL